MLREITHLDFQPHLQSVFHIHFLDDESLEAKLFRVDTIGQEPKNKDQRWAFSLVFQTETTEDYYNQKIYSVSHPVIGSFELFLVPMGPDENGFCYEAVFT